jgi:hypothetical protein
MSSAATLSFELWLMKIMVSWYRLSLGCAAESLWRIGKLTPQQPGYRRCDAKKGMIGHCPDVSRSKLMTS